jgi:hypothetical protein
MEDSRGGVEIPARWFELDRDRRNADGIDAYSAQR